MKTFFDKKAKHLPILFFAVFSVGFSLLFFSNESAKANLVLNSDIDINITDPIDPFPTTQNCTTVFINPNTWFCYTLTANVSPAYISYIVGHPSPSISWSSTLRIVNRSSNILGINFFMNGISVNMPGHPQHGYNAHCTIGTTESWPVCLGNATAYGPNGSGVLESTASGITTINVQNIGTINFFNDLRFSVSFRDGTITRSSGDNVANPGFSITVGQAPTCTIISFTCGTNAQLTWATSNCTSRNISQGIGSVGASGQIQANPGTSYTLTAEPGRRQSVASCPAPSLQARWTENQGSTLPKQLTEQDRSRGWVDVPFEFSNTGPVGTCAFSVRCRPPETTGVATRAEISAGCAVQTLCR